MSVEHILLSTAVDEPPQERSSSVRVNHAHLDQYSRFRRCEAHFVLFDNHYIAVRTAGLGQKPCSYQVDLAFLDPKPKRARNVSWRCLLGCIIFTGLAWLSSAYGSVIAAVATGAGAVLCVLLAVYHSHDRLVFYSRHGRVPLLILFNRNPDPQRFESFVDALIRLVAGAHADWRDVTPLLSAELREHRRLLEEGVLSAKRYEIVKQRILKQHQ